MLKQEKDMLGVKEFFSVVAIILGTKASDMTTSLLYGEALNAAWMVILGSFVIFLPSLIMLNSVMKKNHSKNLVEVIRTAFGKYLGFCIGLVLFFVILIATAVDTRSYTDQLIVMNFPKTPIFILYLLFLLISMWGAKKGWEAVGSVSWMVFPYIFLSLLFLAFLLFKEGILNRIFPLFGPGKWEVAKISFKYVSIWGDAFVMAMMYPFVKDHKTYSKGLFGAIFLLVVGLALFYLLYALVFDYRSIEKMIYPFADATRLVSLGRNVTHIETIYLTFWLLAVLVKYSIYLYVLARTFGAVFHIKEFEHTILPLTILVLLLGMLPENQMVDVFILRKTMLIYSKYLFLGLPFLLWFVLKAKEVIKK